MSTQPNILWICTDQQRYDTIFALGNKYAQTPNLISWLMMEPHSQMLFCQSPVCAPSRASFLTGRYPRTTRCRQNGQSIPPDELLVSTMFQKGQVQMRTGRQITPCILLRWKIGKEDGRWI